jgi:hypothetical protein
MDDTHGKFYLGRIFDPQKGQVASSPLLYEPADLTTHAVVVGMTGSGKTGLCISLLEEAALQGIPALMIDPKGDITNALLHFPDLLPQDFQPWVNPDQARREGKTTPQAALDAAQRWKAGLAEWGIAPERIAALKNAAQFAVYTPGSDAGIPVSILASLKCPPIPWNENREILREKISGTVTALLGLVGLQDIDPVRSREHILLANIFEHAWSQGEDRSAERSRRSLDLGELILQTQTPPFPKLGVFDVNTFFPEKDRFSLAMLLNNILAAPAFQAWIEGQPLDIPGLLYGADGRPRHSVFYIAHLTDSERMFFVTLLYSAVETWMRSQPGTASLRAIVYFDEIFGYLPPIGAPPSKPIMLRMLKQARAFGVGQVLVTQNPVDVDYKALSNAGTWLIGKLQTEQDKQRLLDGLESAAAAAGGLDRAAYDRLISALGKRVFLLHNIHAKGPQLFQTRWAMNFLAGPLTRAQIPALNQLVGGSEPPAASSAPTTIHKPTAADQPPDSAALDSFQPIPFSPTESPAPPQASPTTQHVPLITQPAPPTTLHESTSTTRPTLPAGIKEYFLPNNLTFTQAFKAAGQDFPPEAFSQGIIYRPAILAQAHIRFLNRKYRLDHETFKTVLAANPDRRGVVRWENYASAPVDPAGMDNGPIPQARFAALESPFSEARTLSAMQKDFLDWAYRTAQVTVRAHEGLKLYAGPDISPAEFRTLCADASRQGRDAEIKKVAASYDAKLKVLYDKLTREERELTRDQVEYEQRKWEERGNIAEFGASIFGIGRKKSLTTTLTKRRLTEQSKAEVDESVEAIKEYRQQISALEQEKAQAIDEVNRAWGDVASQVTEMPVAALKKDVLLDLFGVAWVPYHVAKIGEGVTELPGFGAV